MNDKCHRIINTVGGQFINHKTFPSFKANCCVVCSAKAKKIN
ncbi:hypothetical protein DOY81_007246 [Sarcophaga bullata]|nr:hypothetical protein DOY81_007246 [Sarcophaga bullata]